jgi:surfactin synthase thioesterase subunit
VTDRAGDMTVPDSDDAVAIVGLAAQVPGAEDVEQFWLNLVCGRTASAAPVDGQPRDSGSREDLATGLTLEVAHAAIGNAGYDPRALRHDVGVFTSASPGPADYANAVADRLRLRGPAVTCRADCSGLGALRLATQSVRAGACGMALVACATAQPEAACAVVIKRLRDALADHDHLWAVIRGIACADGSAGKEAVGALGPAPAAVEGAMAQAGARPEDISYVEACGGRSPSDVAALTAAYTSLVGPAVTTGRCGLGSGQGTVELPGSAAALAAIVKVALALEREQLPASLTDPRLDLSGTPFHFHDRVAPWPRDPLCPRLAAVCALGNGEVGGHVVLTEAPRQKYAMHAEQPTVVVWSGRTAAEERVMRKRLARYFVWRGEEVFTDAAATLRHGRTTHPVRAAAVCTGSLDAASVLGATDSPRVITPRRPARTAAPVTLLFAGRGSALAARDLYRGVPAFARALDDWLDLLDGPGLPVRSRWRVAVEAADSGEAATDAALLFAVEAALGQIWQEAGVGLSAVAGDGIGTLAAAWAAQVFAPANAGALVRILVSSDSNEALEQAVAEAGPKQPAVPLYCGPTGGEVTAAEADDPAFWAQALRAPAATAGGFDVGDGMLAAPEPGSELTVTSLLTTAARLWTDGHPIAWESLGQPPLRHRVPMPAPAFADVAENLPLYPLAAATRPVRHHPGATPVSIDLLTPPASGPMVLAIPYAGGSGRAFQAVRGYILAGCGLALVDLPGHGRRIGRECLRDVDAVISELLAVLPALPTRRVILLGYSLGGSFCYELAARLTEAGTPPEGLIVCGTRSPQTGVGHPPLAHLPSGKPFLRVAVAMGLAAPEMLELPELAESFAAPLQADLAMVESFPYRPRRPPLPVPVCVVGLRGDWVVPEPSLRAWDDLSVDRPLQLRVDGGHLALHEREREFGEAIRRALEHVLDRATSCSLSGGGGSFG